MKFSFRNSLAALMLLGLGALVTTIGPVQRAIGQGMTHFFPLVGTEQISLNYPCTVSCYATTTDIVTYGSSQAGANSENTLIGGDFTTNLFQDGTSVGSITTTPTYVADQWAAFSGTSTTIAGAQETGTADVPSNFGASLRITRSGSGILQSCVVQEIRTADSLRYQGQTAEIDFHALAGSGFSAANSVLNVLVVTGTATDEGLTNLAHSINSALGGSNWTGVATLTVPVTISTTWNRYSAVVPIPAAATEIGVALCFTPVGASPSSDYFEFTGAQLVPNAALTSVAGTAGAALSVNDKRAKSFARRNSGTEADLQYAFYQRTNEPATTNAGAAAVYAPCRATSTTAATCLFNFPRAFWKLPTLAYTAGTIAVTSGASNASEAVSAAAIASNGATLAQANVTLTSTSLSSGVNGFLQAGNSTGGGSIIFSARL
jgi:hypothetical protein